MASPDPESDATEALADRLTKKVAECLRRVEGRGDPEVDAVCADAPDLAALVRERIAIVLRAGAVEPKPARKEAGALQRIGHYRILAELGRGGQGTVYRAKDEVLGREVALKVLSRGAALSPSGALRFKREAEATSRLDHPGICAIYDAGEWEGCPYLVMRIVRGQTFARWIHGEPTASWVTVDAAGTPDSDAPTPTPTPTPTTQTDRGKSGSRRDSDRLDTILLILEKVARALQHAHSSGVLHRDIKPGNIMISADGEPVILDFGLAQDLDEGAEVLTQSGDLLGSPPYMSPEQITGLRVGIDRRSDVYSLGVVLYEAVARRRPFESPTRQGLYHAILTKEPTRLARLVPGLPRDLDRVASTAMHKDRDRRYQTAADFAEDLRRLRQGLPILARPEGPWQRASRWVSQNRVVAALGSGIVLLLGLALALSIERNRSLERAHGQRDAAIERGDLLVLLSRLRVHERESHELFPTRPQMRERLSEWMQTARGLLREGDAIQAEIRETLKRARPDDEARRLADHGDLVAENRQLGLFRSLYENRLLAPGTGEMKETWRSRIASLDQRLEANAEALRRPGTPRFDGDDDRLKYQLLVDARTELDRLAYQVEGDSPAAVNRRLAHLDRIEAELGATRAQVWAETQARVLGHPPYLFHLPEQTMLWPLGPDPDSNLEEFLDLSTHEGPIPERDPVTRRIPIVESTGIILVLIPPLNGVIIGAQKDSKDLPNYDALASSDEQPTFSIRLDAYFISKYEMTQGQWWRLLGENPSTHQRQFAEGPIPDLCFPVETCTLEACVEALRRSGLVFPTECQWEAAARATSTAPWPTGPDPDDLMIGDRGVMNVVDLQLLDATISHANFHPDSNFPDYEDGSPYSCRVDSFGPNAYGLFNVLGNVSEICRDDHISHEDPRNPGEGEAPPSAIISPDSVPAYKTCRGGSWVEGLSAARHSSRADAKPPLHYIGLRPARRVQPD